jgi:hypothetical protein
LHLPHRTIDFTSERDPARTPIKHFAIGKHSLWQAAKV